MLAKMPAVKGFSSLIEPLYAPGHVLMDDDLTAAVLFTRNLSRLLFRSLFGCGVICGYKIEPKLECERLKITVEPGVALDCHGDPVELKSAQALCVGETCGETIPDHLWVIIRGTENACAPRELACPSDDEDDACGCHATRAQAGYEIKVVDKLPCGACGCGETKQTIESGGKTILKSGAMKPLGVAPPATILALNTVGRARLESLTKDIEASRTRAKTLAADAATLKKGVAQIEDKATKLQALAQAAADAAQAAGGASADLNKKAAAAKQEAADQWAALDAAKQEAEVAAANAELEPMRTSALNQQLEEHKVRMGEAFMALEGGKQTAAGADCCDLIAPRTPCHKDHYDGVCSCCCGDGCDGWVVLGEVVLAKKPIDEKQPYEPAYGDRRFIRPVLAADPLWRHLS